MMKKKDANAPETKKAVEEMMALQKMVKELKLKFGDDEKKKLPTCDKDALDALLQRRMFVVPSFDIYGGVKGLYVLCLSLSLSLIATTQNNNRYDLGPPACALKANMLHLWRNHFVLEEGMLEVECTNMTPEKVLKTSGHVDKFSDLMVKDSKTGDCLRADHLLENHIDRLLDADDLTSKQRQELEHIRAQADAYDPKQLHEKMNKLGIKDSNEKLFEMPYEFNLMFKTTIGPEGTRVGYLRPETAQGIFVNFKKLLEYNTGKMPFAAAQIGTFFLCCLSLSETDSHTYYRYRIS